MIAVTADYVTCRNMLGFAHWRRAQTGAVYCNTLVPVSMLPAICPSCGALLRA